MPASFRVACLLPVPFTQLGHFSRPLHSMSLNQSSTSSRLTGGVSISINANIETVQALHSVDLVVAGAFRMYMPVKVDRAMSHIRPVSHGEMAKGQLLLVVL